MEAMEGLNEEVEKEVNGSHREESLSLEIRSDKKIQHLEGGDISS